MSPRHPVANAKDVVRVATSIGFVFDHQKGSHAVYYRAHDRARIVIPMHGHKDFKPKTLKGIVEDMRMTMDEFQRALSGQ